MRLQKLPPLILALLVIPVYLTNQPHEPLHPSSYHLGSYRLA